MKSKMFVVAMLCAMSASTQAYKITDYFEGPSFAYGKFFGPTNRDSHYITSSSSSYNGSNWKWTWQAGPNGNGKVPAWEIESEWYFKWNPSTGSIYENADWGQYSYFDGYVDDYTEYMNGYAIPWGKAGGMNVGDGFGNFLTGLGIWRSGRYTGSFWGYGYTELGAHYNSYTIPSMYHPDINPTIDENGDGKPNNDSWTSPAVTFHDVIRLDNWQPMCSDPSERAPSWDLTHDCKKWTVVGPSLYLAKGFGIIKYDYYNTNSTTVGDYTKGPYRNSAYVRMICRNSKCQVPTQYPNF